MFRREVICRSFRSLEDLKSTMTDALCHLVVDGNEVLDLKLVRREEDVEDESTSFAPEMCHQVFGENENIFGYTDLHIHLFYTAAALHTYLGIQYEDKIKPEECDGVKADDIEHKLADVLAPGYTTNLDDFLRFLGKEEHFTPPGKMELSFNAQSEESNERRTFEVYYCEAATPGWLAYHARLQTFLLWYVDAASFIDVDDDQWTYFAVFEKYANSEGGSRYAVAGYGTVYRYYAYPHHVRPRISQVLVLPPFRKMGICSNLVKAINEHFSLLPEVVDTTVEDPSAEFQRIRDYVDASNCMALPAFQPQHLHNGFTEEMAMQARSKFKINKKQARRVYEILRLKHTNTSDHAQYQAYRLHVKNRLNAPFQKRQLEKRKMEKVLGAEELAATASLSGPEETRARLAGQYRALEEEYRRVIHRMDY